MPNSSTAGTAPESPDCELDECSADSTSAGPKALESGEKSPYHDFDFGDLTPFLPRFEYTVTDSGNALPWYPKEAGEDLYKDLYWSQVDAALGYPATDKVYLFSGASYVRLDVDREQMHSGYPRSISGSWKGVPDDIDAAFFYPNNGRIYFFKGQQYFRYLPGSGVESGYPKSTARYWPGLPTPVNGAVYDEDDNCIYFFQDDDDRTGSNHVCWRPGIGVLGTSPRVGEINWRGARSSVSAAAHIREGIIDLFHPPAPEREIWTVFNKPDGTESSKKPPHYDARIHETMLTWIGQAPAGSKIRIMIGGWQNPKDLDMVQPIIDAHRRGVDIRLITNPEGTEWLHINPTFADRLDDAGVRRAEWNRRESGVRDLGLTSSNHAKFMLVSEVPGSQHIVADGSSNWRTKDRRRQNDLIVISDEEMFDEYLRWFDHIWDLAKNRPADPVDPYLFGKLTQLSNGLSISFLPAVLGKPKDPHLSILRDAHVFPGVPCRAWVAASTWHRVGRGIAVMDELARLKKQGCDVRILGEYKKANIDDPETTTNTFSAAKDADIPRGKGNMHTKFMVVDAAFASDSYRRHEVVVTGPLNFSSAIEAPAMLDSTVTLVDEPDVFDSYSRHWKFLCETCITQKKAGRDYLGAYPPETCDVLP